MMKKTGNETEEEMERERIMKTKLNIMSRFNNNSVKVLKDKTMNF